jgi:VIT1/CCC1 family predicted Fe2+/Mn2+ transporter
MDGDKGGADGPDAAGRAEGPHAGEPHQAGLAARLNWLRAGVLGANDGIVSTAGLVVGVAGASASRTALVTAGLAGLLAGALSMAAGEYVSVSTQRDTERAALETEREELATDPAAELAELAGIYRSKGLSHELAHEVAEALTKRDALAAHAEAELGIAPDDLTNPWQAALASFAAFTVGALLPLLAILLPPASLRVPVTVCAVLAALAATGWASARLGSAPVLRAVLRNVLGGGIAMGITYAAGVLLHVERT